MFKRKRTVKKRRPTKARHRRKSVRKMRAKGHKKQRGGVDHDNQCAICQERNVCGSCIFGCNDTTNPHKFCTECTTALIGRVPEQQVCPMCRRVMLINFSVDFLFDNDRPAMTCGRVLGIVRDVVCPYMSIRTPLFLLSGIFSIGALTSEHLSTCLIGAVGLTASYAMAGERRAQDVQTSVQTIRNYINSLGNQSGGGDQYDPTLYICCMYKSGNELKRLYFKPEDLKKEKEEILKMFKEKDNNITDETVITTVFYFDPSIDYKELKTKVSDFSLSSLENNKSVFK